MAKSKALSGRVCIYSMQSILYAIFIGEKEREETDASSLLSSEVNRGRLIMLIVIL